ncbi:MAG: efflux RND transporter periplasmic adaptor subunit, partial [Verrucomicrobia bacterium]|nr:efflux RND transporter periplasmic adaptor subunit [Verrucomicrobiota bacterium]
ATVSRVPQRVEITAQVEGTREVEVRARVTGILLAQTYREGERVKAGDLLFRIEPAPYRIALQIAQAQLAQDQSRLEQAQAEADRQAALLAQNATSKKEESDAQALVAINRALRDLSLAKVKAAELDLSYCEVTAPIDGFTGRLLKSEGSLVSPGVDGLLTTIVQRDAVWIRFGLSEQEFVRLFKGEAGLAKQALVNCFLPGGLPYPVAGKINFVSAEVDSRLGTIGMRAEFANPQQTLLPGQYVRIQLSGQEIPEAFIIPATALMQSSQGRYVFTVNAENKVVLSIVQVAEIAGNQAVIQSGLKAGDRVITDNLQKLRSGFAVTLREPATSAK